MPAAPVRVPAVQSKLSREPGKFGMAIFGLALIVGFIFAIAHLLSDLSTFHPTSVYPFVLPGVALLIALGFEFVNGFHDTANAVATVIYTHSLDPHVAVVLSGTWNFLGVLTSTGAVAFGIITRGLFVPPCCCRRRVAAGRRYDSEVRFAQRVDWKSQG
jgi:inorganic phosphate transporter, PiT family